MLEHTAEWPHSLDSILSIGESSTKLSISHALNCDYISMIVSIDHSLINTATGSYVSSFQMMRFLILIYFFIVQGKVLSITLGVITNASIHASHGNMTITRSTCDQCLCEMINGSSNVSILALNCLQYNSSQVKCQLFTTSDYDQMSWFTMLDSVGSSFYFSELPSISTTSEIHLPTKIWKLV